MPKHPGAVRSGGQGPAASPDLSAEEVFSRVGGDFWRKILFYDSVDSTNDVGAGLIACAGAEPGTVVLADAQDRGKGRRGRRWLSPPGQNIYMSIILRPEISPRDFALLTLLAAVSSAGALRRVTAADVSIKWPNDLVLSGRKLGGILTEVKSGPDRTIHAVIGIGLNVNAWKKDLPDEIKEIATSLAIETGRVWVRTGIAAAILDEFEHLYKQLIQEGRGPLIRECRRLSSTLGKKVLVVTGKMRAAGVAEDIDDEGMLLLRLPSGEIRRVSAGDLEMLR